MMRRKKTHSLSYFRGEKKHSRKKRFDPYLPLYLKAIVRSSSREVPLEGRSERETEDDEFYFLPPISLLPSFEDTEKKEKDGSFLMRERSERDFPFLPFCFFWPTSPSLFKNTDHHPKRTRSY